MTSPGAVAGVTEARKAPATMLATLLLLCTILKAAGQRINTVDAGSSTYFVSSQSPYNAPHSWYLAYQYCRTIGMELLTEDTQEQGEKLRDFLSANGYADQSFWTSGNQLGSSQWLWMTSGLPFNASFNFWAAQEEPLATTSDDSCMLLQSGEWRSAPCTQPHHFICQLTRCYFFNYVRSNTPSQQAAVARSTRASFLAPGVRSVSSTAPDDPEQPTTARTPARRPRKPITANRVIHFPTIVPLVLTPNATQAAAEQAEAAVANTASTHTGDAIAVHRDSDLIVAEHQSLGKNSTLSGSHTLSEDESPAGDQQTEQDVEAHTQEDLDELLRQTAESNAISGATGPTLSKLLQPPDLPPHGAQTQREAGGSVSAGDHTATITRPATAKTTHTATSGSRTRVDQLERKEVFSWALLPDTPQS